MYHGPEDNPCYQCSDREPGCHSNCVQYTGYKGMLDDEKEIEEKGRRKDYPEKVIRPRRREKRKI